MVQFIKPNGMIFSVARTSEDAFYMWNLRHVLYLTVKIDGVDYGNGWRARTKIEELFKTSYTITQ